ncbi:aqualysin-1-like [Sycon ciliatum]|uniref:aqualysin-1-like n=1 Tax=Sycon ciliatum TaxID=27933 RepID=UPI0020AEBCCA|eukprot:scpid80906/ scgid19600/ Aqualysin-1; Aqualysin-I
MKLLVLLALLPCVLGRAPLLNQEAKEIVENEYIVVFHSSINTTTRAMHMDYLRSSLRMSEVDNTEVMFEYNIEGPTLQFRGYSVRTSMSVINGLLDAPEVDYIGLNQKAHALQTCNRQTEATWGLERIAKPDLPLAGYYEDQEGNQGADVDVYVIDTGVRTTHVEFGTRAKFGYDSTSPPTSPIETDDNGHGTHVAGTIGGSTYGVAKASTLIGVKVLNQAGSGSYAGVIAGIDYAATECRSGTRKCVGNMSLGGGFDSAVNAATDASVDAGVFMAVAAGNSYGANACNYSPASSNKATTVGSTDNTDARSVFSNIGNCIEVFAPGTSITSAWYTSDTATNTISGTSMASPHVAGVGARVFSANPTLTAPGVEAEVQRIAAVNKISNVGSGSPNLLVQGTCDLQPPPNM